MPCNPSPCGANAQCREQNGAGSCTCLPDYFGDPYSGCRPECVMNSECPRDKSCVNNKCKDPCPGTCGLNADCRVNNHIPTCNCLPGFTGDALRSCHQIPPQPSKTLFLFPSVRLVQYFWANLAFTYFFSSLSFFFSCNRRTDESLLAVALWTLQ